MKEQQKPGIKTAAVIVALALLVSLPAYWFFFRAPEVPVFAAVEGTVARLIHGPGVVTARIQVTVSTRVTGMLKEVHADQGDRVKAGQTLALLDDVDVAAKAGGAQAAAVAAQRNVTAAEAALARARADMELARSDYRRDDELFRAGLISRAAMDAATAALKSAQSVETSAHATLAARQADARASTQESVYASALHAFTRITASMDGLIVARDAEVGDTVVPGSPIFLLVDTRTLWVAARIDESVVGHLESGQSAMIRLRSGKQLAGEVARINRRSDAATRELEVDVAFLDIPERFAIDQEAEVVIHAGEEQGVVIPSSSLLQHGRAFGALVVTAGRAEFRPLETGASDGERVVVREGLSRNERVIRQPAGIKLGSRVRAVNAGER